MKRYPIANESLYILMVGAIAAIPAVATDMYLGAIPRIAQQWGVPEGQVNLSLVLWFVCFSVNLLLCGPLSDRFGRRPVLMIGLGLFILSTFLCATASNVFELVFYRVLQGFSAAAPSSMAVAVCRDRFEGAARHRALAYMAIIIGLAPMIAPMMGSLIMEHLGDWHLIFILQAAISLLVGVIALFCFEETVTTPSAEGIFAVLRRYLHLFRNRNYMLSTAIMGMSAGPMLGFVAFSPVLYMNIYKLSNTQFSLLFGANAVMLMAGSYSSTLFSRWISLSRQFYYGFTGCVIAGILILAIGHLHPLAFALPMILFSFSCNVCRPASNNLILSQVSEDIGTASSFMIFYQCIFNSGCMAFSSHGWSDPIAAFGWMMLGISLVVLGLWPVLKRGIAMP